MPIEELLATESIRTLKARYFRLLDTKRWDEWGALFVKDAVLAIPELDRTLSGREAIVAWVRRELEDVRTVHHGHTCEIEITGPETATGIWAMSDELHYPAGDRAGRSVVRGAGHYVEEYRRVDGAWLIARSELARLHLEVVRSSESTRAPRRARAS
jgi:hypothetical protein